ncbi:MAG: UDP-4-amino-4,6-dideoxy-N-acetyl-beta-L-altrosamine transaminase [Deltaproteobacteria bacterium]|nr:UDP-4-amino-4,6-dideoxy-N-acetyl-beta-L-altrosamine transaminase [Deltaproteobacteria bacterium]
MPPGLPYGRQWIDEDDIQAVVRALRGDFLTQGPAVAEFESALAKACGARHAIVVANGTVALHLSCLAAGLGPGDEGITSPITFAASANCMAYCGATPKFVDIQPGTWNLNHELVEGALTPRTKVLIPVHFAGLPCDLREIRALADRRGLILIADAAHALGATYQGHPMGGTSLAHMTCLSFHPVKHVTTGEGGAILTDDDSLARRLRALRHHGIVNDPSELSPGPLDGAWYHEVQYLGFNGRLTDIQCALGMSQLAKLPAFLSRRQEIARKYRAALAALPGIRFQAQPADRTHAYHLFVIWMDPKIHDRRRVHEELRKRDIFTQVHYIPVHLHPYYRNRFGTHAGQYPIAEEYYAGALSLPMYPAMTDGDVERVTSELIELLG